MIIDKSESKYGRTYNVCDNCKKVLYFTEMDNTPLRVPHPEVKFGGIAIYNKSKHIYQLEREDIFDLLPVYEQKEYDIDSVNIDTRLITHKSDSTKDMKVAELCEFCYKIYKRKLEEI